MVGGELGKWEGESERDVGRGEKRAAKYEISQKVRAGSKNIWSGLSLKMKKLGSLGGLVS